MIKFPKVHIATSVVNRILNVADGITPIAPQAAPGDAAPDIPDTTRASINLDKQLAQGIPGTLPGADQVEAAGDIVTGMPTLDALVKGP